MTQRFRVILISLFLVLGLGGASFFLWQRNSSQKTQEEILIPKVKKKTGGFTPLIKKNLGEIKREKKGSPPENLKVFAPKIGSFAPKFILENLKGEKVTLKDFEGKNLLLVFWATYCGWCAKEKEDLIRFTHEQKDLLEVVAVVDEPKKRVLDYIQREKVNFRILLDKERVTFDQYQIIGTPAHFLIDKKGKIVDWRPGYTAYDGFLWMIKNLKK